MNMDLVLGSNIGLLMLKSNSLIVIMIIARYSIVCCTDGLADNVTETMRARQQGQKSVCCCDSG